MVNGSQSYPRYQPVKRSKTSPSHAGFCSVNFGVLAPVACYGCKTLGLYIEYFAYKTSGLAKFIHITLSIATFGTGVVELLDNSVSLAD